MYYRNLFAGFVCVFRIDQLHRPYPINEIGFFVYESVFGDEDRFFLTEKLWVTSLLVETC